jgi:hypothetical protein
MLGPDGNFFAYPDVRVTGRREYILLRVTTVILGLLVAAMLVFIALMIAGVH